MLAAVAVSCCQSLSDLIPLAVETVKIAFRTGVCVTEVRCRVELGQDSTSSWSAMVPGLTGEAAVLSLEKFGEEKVRYPKWLALSLLTK
jgi:hypothetical protein